MASVVVWCSLIEARVAPVQVKSALTTSKRSVLEFTQFKCGKSAKNYWKVWKNWGKNENVRPKQYAVMATRVQLHNTASQQPIKLCLLLNLSVLQLKGFTAILNQPVWLSCLGRFLTVDYECNDVEPRKMECLKPSSFSIIKTFVLFSCEWLCDSLYNGTLTGQFFSGSATKASKWR